MATCRAPALARALEIGAACAARDEWIERALDGEQPGEPSRPGMRDEQACRTPLHALHAGCETYDAVTCVTRRVRDEQALHALHALYALHALRVRDEQACPRSAMRPATGSTPPPAMGSTRPHELGSRVLRTVHSQAWAIACAGDDADPVVRLFRVLRAVYAHRVRLKVYTYQGRMQLQVSDVSLVQCAPSHRHTATLSHRHTATSSSWPPQIDVCNACNGLPRLTYVTYVTASPD